MTAALLVSLLAGCAQSVDPIERLGKKAALRVHPPAYRRWGLAAPLAPAPRPSRAPSARAAGPGLPPAVDHVRTRDRVVFLTYDFGAAHDADAHRDPRFADLVRELRLPVSVFLTDTGAGDGTGAPTRGPRGLATGPGASGGGRHGSAAGPGASRAGSRGSAAGPGASGAGPWASTSRPGASTAGPQVSTTGPGAAATASDPRAAAAAPGPQGTATASDPRGAAATGLRGELAKLRSAGAVMQNRGVGRPALRGLPYAGQRARICGQQRRLRSRFGVRPRLLRPPYGRYDTTTRRAAADCGIAEVVLWRAAMTAHGLAYRSGEEHLRPGDIVLVGRDDSRGPTLDERTVRLLNEAQEAGLTVARLEDYL
nr:polysaccharide deacetylase family protein [Streptomyces mangrovisoli]